MDLKSIASWKVANFDRYKQKIPPHSAGGFLIKVL